MLDGIGLDQEFCRELTRLLNRWTATRTQIYHHHGIPQGPLSSGLISEAVLKHFDESFKPRFDVKYLRYVDDIRLFAKNEDHLRHALVQLDHLSKDVGLFPQSAKIHIHRVTDIRSELKSVSVPLEEALTGPTPDQRGIQRRLAELAPRSARYTVSDPTRFKFLLSRASPSLRILDRLWRVFDRAPHFYPQLVAYLQKFDVLPASHADRLLAHIKGQDLYPVVRTGLVDAANGRMPVTRTKKLKALLKPLWKPRTNAPDLSAALWRALHTLSHLTERQTDYALLHAHSSWLRANLQFGVPWLSVSAARRDRLLNASMRDQDSDTAVAAAWLGALLDIDVHRPIRHIHPLAKIVLRESGKLRRANASVCGIRLAVKEMTGLNCEVKWRTLFGKRYGQAEAKIVACKGYYKTNPTAWVNMLDVFNDLLLDSLFRKDGTVGAPSLGNFGGITHNVKFKTKYPKTHAYAVLLHEKRLESELSHAVVKATNAPTGRISFKWLKVGRTALSAAVAELQGAGY
jgi:hypothetical protein